MSGQPNRAAIITSANLTALYDTNITVHEIDGQRIGVYFV